ncbi:MAG: hypothetical protein AVDCRST_MAG73-4216, partial [uncultured Thermomicrobiales bacterium]
DERVRGCRGASGRTEPVVAAGRRRALRRVRPGRSPADAGRPRRRMGDRRGGRAGIRSV